MQTILGAGGPIGRELAKNLTEHTQDIRLVSRNPQKVNPDDQLFPADLTDTENVRKAIAGSEVIYVTIGFEYSAKAWAEKWPPFMNAVIDACAENKARLVFFDNVYMYDPAYMSDMTEETPINPVSKKGIVRRDIADALLAKMREGAVEALIARSADFYGPGKPATSVLSVTVFNPLSSGKKAQWFCADDKKHSFTYIPDAGKALAILGNSDKAYGQVWHLPTAPAPLTGKQFIELAAAELGVEPDYMVLSKFMTKILGFFIPVLKESSEMLYQYDRDYVFNSGKFEKAFDFKPTSYVDGIREIIRSDYKTA